MWKIKIFFISALLIITGKINGQNPNWNSWIIIPPNPSPYISDWENNPGSITYSLQYFGETETEVFLDIGIVSDLDGNVFSGRSELIYFDMGAELREFSSTEIIDWNTINWNKNIESQIIRTGRFPEGEYFACILAVDSENNLLVESCINFSIVYPEAPYLISPIDEEEVQFPQPTFQWTPVLDFHSIESINYSIRIVEIIDGQAAQEAILANPTHFEFNTISTTLSYPPSAQYFEEGKHYAWQVQALDENDIPIANNGGKSEIWSFLYKGILTALTDIGFVYDGLSNDDDYTNSTNELSANWDEIAEAASYLYAIGTTEGGTDVLDWTENGTVNSFTNSSLSLINKKKYYVSVKTENADASFGEVKSSDGITIDTKQPTSKLEIDVPFGKDLSKRINSSFKVSWSVSENISPVSFDVQFKHEKDITWNTWLANTVLNFSTFSADIFKSDGKYYFRVQTKDLAGNIETPKNKPEDEIIVDTKPPSSNIKKLMDQQQDANFKVEWTGEDPKPGSGIEYYDIQVKEDNGNWSDWLIKHSSTSGTFQGKEGKKYSFRSAATDLTGNKEQYPTFPDATTQISTTSYQIRLMAKVKPTEIYYSPGKLTNDYQWELTYQAPAGNTIYIDSVEASWYTEGKLYQQLTQSLGKTITLGSSQTTTQTQSLTLTQQSINKALGNKSKVKYEIQFDFKGKDQNGTSFSYYDNNADLTVNISSADIGKRLVAKVKPTEIYYSPGKLTNDYQWELTYQAQAGNTIYIDSVEASWYTESKLYQQLKQSLGKTITLGSSQTTTQTQSLTLTQQSISKALGGKSKAVYEIQFDFIGKDQNGTRVSYYDNSSNLTVNISSTDIGKRLVAKVNPTEIYYSPGKLTNDYQLELTYQAPAGNTIYIDSVEASWYTEGTLYQQLKQSLGKTITLGSSQTSKQTQSLAISSQNISKALGGKSKAVYEIQFDFIGKDQNGTRVSYYDNSSNLTVNISSTDIGKRLAVKVKPTEIYYSPGKLTNDYQWELTYQAPAGNIIYIDSVEASWYTEGTLYQQLKQSLGKTITLGSSQTTTQTQSLTLTQQSINKALGNKSKVTYKVQFDFIGKDQNGTRVSYYDNSSKLTVNFSTADLKFIIAEVIPEEIYYSPSKLSNEYKIDLAYHDLGGGSVVFDSIRIDWYDSDKKLYNRLTQPIKIPRKLNTTETTTINLKLDLTKETFDTAVGNKATTFYNASFHFIGKDQDGKSVLYNDKTTNLTVNFSTADLKFIIAEVIPKEIYYSPSKLSNEYKIDLAYHDLSGGSVVFDSIRIDWYDSDKKLYNRLTQPIKIPRKLSTTETTTINLKLDLTKETFETAVGNEVTTFYNASFHFIGKDQDGKSVSYNDKATNLKVRFNYTDFSILLVNTEPSKLNYSPKKLSNDYKFTFNYTATPGESFSIDSLSSEWYDSDGKLYKKVNQSLGTTIKLGPWEKKTITQSLKFTAQSLGKALGNKSEATYKITFSFIGKDQNGTEINSTNTDADLTVNMSSKDSVKQEQDTLLTNIEDYVLIPKVAIVKAFKDLTTVSKQGSNIVLNGPVQLILIPDPFDSTKIAVDATNLTFSPKPNVVNAWQIKSGNFLEEGTILKKDLFSIYKGIIKINKISYDHSRSDKLRIDNAVADIPVVNQKIYFKNMLIDENGLNLNMPKQEFAAYGFTFSVSNIQKKSGKSGDLFSLTAGIKIKWLKNQEYKAQLVVIDNNGKKNVEINSLTNNPFQLIPGKNYLNFKSFKFVEKNNDNWILEVEVTSNDLPLYSKLGLGSITTTFKYEKSGKMSGILEPIKETKTGYDSNDKSVIKIGKFGAIDLTYLGLKIAALQKIATVDSKPDTTWEIDKDNSHFGIAADLHLPFAGKVLGDASGVINIGDYNKPGIKVDFNGKISSETISVSSNKKLDLGPVFLTLTKLAVTPDPFALAISGGFGVDMKNVFSGEIKIEGLKIDSDGKFTNFNQVVKGGNLSILKIVKFGIDNLEYESTSSKLSFTGGDDNKSNSIQVDSYFRLKGANLSIGKSKAAGGGFDQLLIYEYQGNTNFILENGKLSVKDAIDLTIDIQYAKKANEEYLSVGGDATIAKKWGATLYGKIGERDGDATVGFFAAVKNLQISLVGPLMLDKIGAGFFYRPTKKDVNKVLTVGGIKPIKIDKAFSYSKPKGSSDYKCAVFLNAGIIVSEKSLVEGQAMITITENYFRLDANVKALEGKATGSAFININWANEYAEGKFQFGIDFVVITAEEKDNYFQFYAYDKSNWGVMGKTDIKCFFIDTKSQFYIGNQGFLYDFSFGYSLDIGILEGGLNYEIMAWWRKDVNWGIYAKGKIWGEFLWGLAGGKAVVEGALISPPFTVYVAGQLTLTLCYIEVFDGRVWLALGEEGFDGGTGGNSKYDKLISDAKNIGKQMKEDMAKLAKELAKARNALYQLSEQQRIAAGKALLKLSAWSGGNGIGAFFAKSYKDWYNHDLHSKKFPYEAVKNTDNSDPTMKQVFNAIWNPKAAAFLNIQTALKNDSIAIAKSISEIESMEAELDNLLTSQADILDENLPKLSELTKLKSPVTKPILTPSVINGKSIQVFNFILDSKEANVLNKSVTKEKNEIEAYRNKLLSMVADYVKKLNEITQIIAGSGTSISAISKEYADTYDKISKYTTRFMDYLNERQLWAANESAKFMNLENKIDSGLASQTKNLTIPSNKFSDLCKQRIDLINGLLQVGAAKNISPPKTDITITNYKDMGKELYYHIPQKGFSTVDNEMGPARQTFVKYFNTSNDIYQAKWNTYTVRCDKVYSRQTKLYTILYDLFDQLSLEAGTRKQEVGSKQNLSIDRGDNLTNQADQIPFVDLSGLVSSTSSAQYASGNAFSVVSQSGQATFQQITNSGIVNANTGTNIAQGQFDKNQITKKADWAKDWDFEKERKYVKQILQVPKIVNLSGNALSTKNTNGYSTLTLNWSGEHPIEIAEYSLSIDGYSNPVKLSDISSSSNQPIIAEFISDGLTDQLTITDNTISSLFQPSDNEDTQSISLSDAPFASLANTSATVGNYSTAGNNLQAWRTVGKKTKIAIPFLNQVHDEGNYDIWIRARGAGGYTIERLSSINIDYCGSSSSTSDFDWSKRESSLTSSDNTQPSTPSVYDGGDTTSSLNQILANWSSYDYESGIQEYQYQVGYFTGNSFNNVSTWISAGGQTEINVRLDQQLIPGKVYYVKVKSLNGAGMWSKEGISDGIRLIDSTPPTIPAITQLTISDSSLTSLWTSSSDVESGILGYLFSVGSSKESSDVINWCATQSAQINLNKTQLKKILKENFKINNTYYFSVKAMNGIGVVGGINTKTVKL